MPLDLKNVGGAGWGPDAPGLFMIRVTDTIATAEGAGYFNAIATRAKVGDVILLVASNGTVFKTISAISNGVVTLGAADVNFT